MPTVHFENCPLCNSSSTKEFAQIQDFGYSQEKFELQQCEKCTLIFTQNHPDQQDIAPYYNAEGYVMHTDTRKGLFYKLYHFAREVMLKKKLKVITEAGYTQGKLLDIGAGTGYFAGFMNKQGWEVTGIETDEDARNIAVDKFGILMLDNDELENLPNNHFHIITLWHVLEHVHNFHHYIQLMNEKLRDDGMIIIAVPNHTSLDAKKYGNFWEGWDVPRHLWHFNKKSIKTLVEQHGLSLTKIYPLTFDPFYNGILSERNKKSGIVLKYIKGPLNGLRSYLNANNKPEEASSPMYILKKRK